MRTVFRFSKGGAARYISHLDLMRTMNRAIRRAGLPAKYSQGFHPHIVMSYAQALGVGYLSTGEYMEIELDDSMAPGDAVGLLNKTLPGGIQITGAWRLAEDFPTLMAAVSAARWLVEFDAPVDEALLRKFTSLLDLETIEVVKEGRNGPAKVDIRPGIYSIKSLLGYGAQPRNSNFPLPQDGGGVGERVEGDAAQGGFLGDFVPKPHCLENDDAKPDIGMEAGSGCSIELMLAAGSKLNIRPELAVQAALGSTDAARAITRIELYTLVNARHTPLYRICIGGDFDERGESHLS